MKQKRLFKVNAAHPQTVHSATTNEISYTIKMFVGECRWHTSSWKHEQLCHFGPGCSFIRGNNIFMNIFIKAVCHKESRQNELYKSALHLLQTSWYQQKSKPKDMKANRRLSWTFTSERWMAQKFLSSLAKCDINVLVTLANRGFTSRHHGWGKVTWEPSDCFRRHVCSQSGFLSKSLPSTSFLMIWRSRWKMASCDWSGHILIVCHVSELSHGIK